MDVCERTLLAIAAPLGAKVPREPACMMTQQAHKEEVLSNISVRA